MGKPSKTAPRKPAAKSAPRKRAAKPKKPTQLEAMEARIMEQIKEVYNTAKSANIGADNALEAIQEVRATLSKGPMQLDRIETYLNRVGQAVVDRGREFRSKLSGIESSVAVLRSGATFMQQLEQDASQLQVMKEIGEKWDAEEHGLQLGDYCDASKEVADELTSMGLFASPASSSYAYYVAGTWYGNLRVCGHCSESSPAVYHLDHPTFLSRARVTAKELGLKPVEAHAEVYRVGDWVVWNTDIPFVTNPPVGPHQVTESNGGEIRINREGQLGDRVYNGLYWAKDFRPATEAEVAAEEARHKEAERAEKAGKLYDALREALTAKATG